MEPSRWRATRLTEGAEGFALSPKDEEHPTHLLSTESGQVQFLQAAGEFERRLTAVLRMKRLSSDELLTLLHGCLTGLDHPVKAPIEGAELDSFLADQDAVGGWQPRIGKLAIPIGGR